MEQNKDDNVLFLDLNPENPTTEIESACVNCGENGTTKFMLTSIPFFKEIIISSFECPHCDYSNKAVQYGSVQDTGVRYTLKVTGTHDLNRRIVKSDHATITVPEIDFEIPPQTQQGTLNTLEGFFMQSIEGLQQEQPVRKIMQPDVYEKIEAYIKQLEKCMRAEFEFTLTLDDPAGNSFIENPSAPQEDPNLTVVRYDRTEAQSEQVGVVHNNKSSMSQTHTKETAKPIGPTVNAVTGEVTGPKKTNVAAKQGSLIRMLNPNETLDALSNAIKPADISEVMQFPATCPMCKVPGIQKMLDVKIPFFKEAIVMAFVCDECGFKNSEIKSGGAISPKGKKLTLTVNTQEDLARDVLKSDTCEMRIPEIELKLTAGTLGGKFTTVEGLLMNVVEQFKGYPFMAGDSSTSGERTRMEEFLVRLEGMSKGAEPFTLILDDPVSNSYIQSTTAPEPDPKLIEIEYERSWKQNEVLGLNDINTADYETIDPVEEKKEKHN